VNILIVKLSSLGDVIQAMPAICALRRGYPSAHITWIVEEYAGEILLDHPSIDRVLILSRRNWLKNSLIPWRSKQTILEMSSFIKALRDRVYDLVIDLQGLFKSGIVVWMSNGKRRVGYDRTRELSYIFLNERHTPFDPDRHAIERYLNLVLAIGGKEGSIEYGIKIGEENRKMVERILEDKGISRDEPVVIISPFARWSTKLWDQKRFAKLADILIDRYKVKVILTGGVNEKDYVKGIVSSMRFGAIDLSGKIGLKEMAFLCTRAKLMISTDTGSMHLASAMGLPVVALFGPTAPWRTGPYGNSHSIVRKAIECSPCFRKRCKNRKCMLSIEVEEVLEKVIPYLEGVKYRGLQQGRYI
jgi:heptosyltransferase-1